MKESEQITGTVEQAETTELQVHAPQPVQGQLAKTGAFSGDMQSFADGQRIAQALATSTLVPKDYQKNVANCMIALEMSQRVNANPMAVMQNLYIIHGRPSWSSQFIIGMINGCGRFSPMRFEMFAGPQDEDKWGCRAYATDLVDGDKLEGPWTSIKMAKAEGWYQKNGSKWKTMPDLMLRYRAAAFFGRLYAPDLLMGMSTDEESRDITANRASITEKEIPKRGFNPAKIAEQKQEVTEQKPVVTDEQIQDNF